MELKLQAVVRHPTWVPGTALQASGRAAYTLRNHLSISLTSTPPLPGSIQIEKHSKAFVFTSVKRGL